MKRLMPNKRESRDIQTQPTLLEEEDCGEVVKKSSRKECQTTAKANWSFPPPSLNNLSFSPFPGNTGLLTPKASSVSSFLPCIPEVSGIHREGRAVKTDILDHVKGSNSSLLEMLMLRKEGVKCLKRWRRGREKKMKAKDHYKHTPFVSFGLLSHLMRLLPPPPPFPLPLRPLVVVEGSLQVYT